MEYESAAAIMDGIIGGNIKYAEQWLGLLVWLPLIGLMYVTLISGYVTNSMVNNDIVPMITK